MRLVKQLGAVAVVAFLGSLVVGAVQGSPLLTLITGVATALLTLLTYAKVVRWTERRDPLEVARAGAAGSLGRGALIGAGMFGAVIALIALFGGYRVDGWGSAGGAVTLIGVTAAAAVTEEVMFRGVLFRIIEERLGTWGALVLTGLVFGLMHIINPHATLWGALAIGIEAGWMLAAAYAATRTLWLPIGLHFAWNYTEAGIFGTDVSGKTGSEGLLDGVTSGPALLTGGDFGPEASLVTVIAGLVVTLLFMRLARRRGTVVPRRRRSAPAGAGTTLVP
ncbi:CAAX amino protease [Sphaerisporangium melleum]|uniref:CAAX amino protease n=1 Tax=Sphaerisporangium melleum TaxID=321316 RepID=A0A917QVE6_9ACTN|nr:type II CAAX endopeptidase family protein [Sphaerisporangium melleum]GGK70963.1 CAAX amino protease [Sphaerisporangium melleum]GII70244.1 CAAX amino protease [Sphaerisporangium melleum]